MKGGTLVTVLIAGLGGILVVAALENKTNLADAFKDIINGTVSVSNSTSFSTPPAGNTGGQSSATTQATGNASTPIIGTNWTNFTETLPYLGKYGSVVNNGVDFGTPFHTPISSLVNGRVVEVSHQSYGLQVVVAFQNAGKTLYAAYVHLDDAMVQVGQQVRVGQQLGLSGGQLSGGLNPVTDPRYSSGAHTLFGVYTADITDTAHSLDPNFIINLFRTANPKGS